MSWLQRLDAEIDERSDEIVAVRRHLHAHPEPSGHEFRTTAYLAAAFQQAGLTVRTGPEDRGLIVDPPARDAAASPRVAIRADIDALRIHDAKKVPYRSQCQGIMHACGHDAHAASVLGAVLGLGAAVEAGFLPWPVCWRGIFQPAEETNVGAQEMIAAGALEDTKAIFSLHMDPNRDVGHVGVRSGVLTASCDALQIRITGRGGHAARPHESIDPIAIAAQLISSIYQFVPRATDSQDPVVVTIGQVVAGDNPNVIPEQVSLLGTLRTLGREVREATKDHLHKLARGMAEASDAAIDVEFHDGPQSVDNDPRLTTLIRQAGGELLGPDHVDQIPRPSMGGEDFANYLEYVPGTMCRVGCRSAATGGYPLHSPWFDVDERALSVGAKLLARAIVLWSDPKRQTGDARPRSAAN